MTNTRNQKMEEVQNLLKTGVEKIQNSEEFKKYLTVMSKFHNYSLNNTLLIYLQNPNATAVAGFNKWKKDFHRTVKKGEKSIRILAPILKNKELLESAENDNQESKNDNKIIVGYRPVPVFDISQTVGEELPQPPTPIDLEGNYSLYEQNKTILQKLTGYKVVEAPREDGADGSCNYETKIISIQKNLSEFQKMKTLLHECGHALLHGSLINNDNLDSFEVEVMNNRHIREVEAESVSFVVGQFLGFDSSEYSFNYIVNWCGKNEYLENSLKRIRNTANQIIDVLVKLGA